jgi:hypothetical protein
MAPRQTGLGLRASGGVACSPGIGDARFTTKPINRRELIEMLRTHLEAGRTTASVAP